MPVCSIVKLLPLGTVDDLMHYCTWPSASCNSASGRPWHLGVIVLTILQTGNAAIIDQPKRLLKKSDYDQAIPQSPSASCNSASGHPWHLGVIVLTILQTGMK